MKLAEIASVNSSFSSRSLGLQLAIDSTSLGAFKFCPRWYYYSIVCGWEPKLENVHFIFGILVHSARERYYHARAKGDEHRQALRKTLAWLLEVTWNKSLLRPWSSDHPTKKRGTLIRTVVWYLEKYADDPMQTIILENGKPAVELSFQFDSGFETADGERWSLCGHMDRLASLNDHIYIDDLKTTAYTISASFFNQFTPHNQFSLYVLASRVVWKQRVEGLIVDGAQVAAGFSRFERAFVPRSEAQLEEWLNATGWWMRQMEACASDARALEALGLDVAAAWPQNEASCGQYGGCKARAVCSRSPVARGAVLETEFKRRVWDPLQRRGDI